MTCGWISYRITEISVKTINPCLYMSPSHIRLSINKWIIKDNMSFNKWIIKDNMSFSNKRGINRG